MTNRDTDGPPNRPEEEAALSSRRSFLATTVLAGGAIILAAGPMVASVVVPSLKKGVGRWIDLGKVDKLHSDDFSMLSFEFMMKDGWLDLPQRGFVWARTDPQAGFKVFSSTCSHLACNVIWSKEAGSFICPCHSGRFDANGQPLSGPPKKPLSLLSHKVENDLLLVHITL